MATTAKLLQTPKIIEIVAGTIRVANPYVKGNIATSLAAPIAASGTSMTVYDNNAFASGDFFVLGDIAKRETEEGSVNGAVTRGQALTVTNTLKFGHSLDTPMTKIYERGIKLYGAATSGGVGTLIASVDAISTPIADAVMVQWEKDYTEITLISTDTTYPYYFAKFTDGTTDSSASTYVPSTGLSYNKIEPLIKQALDMTNSRLDNKRLTRDMYVNWFNDCQDAVKQFVFQDPGSGRFLQKDWSFEVTVDESLPLVLGEDSYDLSLLPAALKYPNSEKSIFSIQIGGRKPLQKIAIKDLDTLRRDCIKTYSNGAAAVGGTTLNVDSTANFDSAGTIQVGSQNITFTSKTATAFLGIPVSGSGSITAIIADNTAVWQNMQAGESRGWTIFESKLLLDRPPSASFAGMTIRIRYLKDLARITSVSDGTEIPFTNACTYYLTAMTSMRLGNADDGAKWLDTFNKQVRAYAIADVIPQLDEWRYYNFSDDVYDRSPQAMDSQNYYEYYV